MSPWLEAYLIPSGQAVRFAVKATLAMLLALYVALWCDLERPYWALISAAFLQIRPMSGMVIEKGLSQLAGTLVGCGVGIAIMALFAQAPVSALASLTLWIMLCTYGSSLLRNNASYGCIMGGVTAMLIVVIGASQPDGIFAIAVARLSELALGAVCATLVSALLWPIRVRDHLADQADQVINEAFRHAGQRLSDSADLGTLQASLTGSLGPLTQLETDSQAARYEGPEGPGRIRASHVLTRRTLRLMATLHALQQLLHHYGDRLDPGTRHLADDLARELGDAAEATGIPQARRRLQTLRHRALAGPDNQVTPLAQRVRLGLRETLGHALVMLDAREAIPHPGRRRLRGAALAWHRDHLAAGLNALRAGVVFVTLAAFWLATGWSNGQVAMLMGTLGSAFFASRDNPAAVSLMFAKGMLAAIPSAFLFGHVLLAQASGFPMLAMFLLPPLFLGLLGAASPRLMGYCLAFTIGNILLTMPGNGMDFSLDGFFNRAIAVMIGLGAVVSGFRLIPGLGPRLHQRRLVGAIARDLRAFPAAPVPEAETRFIGGMADRLLQLARHDDMLHEDQRHLFSLGLTGLDIGYACLQLRRRLDDLGGAPLPRARRAFFAALASAFEDSARGRPPGEVYRTGTELVAALDDRQALSPRQRTMIAGLVERLDLALHHQAERARASGLPPVAAASSAST
ncbi:FUSC family protein [Halomonas nitroreducens]|uniref:FUSC family protein n=1 Tax=Halomonas nitroreducens TaxID=447425 RepID=A0A3S0HRY4_9GAMM|nr:FUSC family protein [Halomonas nitroreducens]RTR00809.1 FUSC family protein [Halomonas nitroreducens]